MFYAKLFLILVSDTSPVCDRYIHHNFLDLLISTLKVSMRITDVLLIYSAHCSCL